MSCDAKNVPTSTGTRKVADTSLSGKKTNIGLTMTQIDGATSVAKKISTSTGTLKVALTQIKLRYLDINIRKQKLIQIGPTFTQKTLSQKILVPF